MGNQGESYLLAGCYRNALELAHEQGLHSIAFPSSSTGIYGYPIEQAAQVSVQMVDETLARLASSIKITSCCFQEQDLTVYESVLAGFVPSIVQ